MNPLQQNAGLSLDFNAGKEQYSHQVAIGEEGNDVLVGGRARDYFGDSPATTKWRVVELACLDSERLVRRI